jgi:hypothetical protein
MRCIKCMLFSLALVGLFLASGCAGIKSPPHPLRDGYDVGDMYRSIDRRIDRLAQLEKAYCQEKDPLAKRLLLITIRQVAPGYPEKGICTFYMKPLANVDGLDKLTFGLSVGTLIGYLVLL